MMQKKVYLCRDSPPEGCSSPTVVDFVVVQALVLEPVSESLREEEEELKEARRPEELPEGQRIY
jgi:hypothetical protein